MSSSTSALQHKKRKLADDGTGSGAAPAPLIRDERVWFADGNVIVRAGPGCMGNGPVYGFRCHSAVLAARSPVFSDMFRLPNTAGEILEGAECVDLPDAWEDVRGLLRYLYSSIDMQPLITPRHPDTLKVISGPLRLAAKYDMETVMRELVPVLERDWPDRYEDWVYAEKGFRLYPLDVAPVPQETHQDPAAAIRLAMDLQLRAVLPAAFYDLSRVAIRKPRDAGPHDRWADAALLGRGDLERLTLGRERIARYLEDVFRIVDCGMRALTEGVEHSRSRSRRACEENLERWWERVHPTAEQMYWSGPLVALEVLGEDLEYDESDAECIADVCMGCRHELSRELQREGRKFWENLPELFDLDSLPFE